jgi:ABC-type uncharacterized transport system substrate-binding protein
VLHSRSSVIPTRARALVSALIPPLAVAALIACAAPAAAHPHVWITVKVTMVFDDQGQFTAAKENWAFDYDFSAIFKEEADTDMSGSISEEEAAQGLTDNLSWIPHYGYFTRLTVAGHEVAHKDPVDYGARFFAGKLYVQFTLPLQQPAIVDRGAGVDVFDPEFYYDHEFDYPDVDAVKTPDSCVVDRRSTPNLDPVAVMLIRKLGLPADPAVINDPATGYAVRVAVTCGAAATAALAAGTGVSSPPPSRPAPNVDK